jgi:hypothetical protein
MYTFLPFTSEDEIFEIADGLIHRTLPKSAWTHAAHFAATIWLLASYPESDVVHRLPNIIRAYNEATGVANTDASGYHETITLASIRAASSFLGGDPRRPLFVTCNELMASPLGRSEWLLTYWSRPRLFSVEGRRTWVEPDVQALPFPSGSKKP